MPKCTRKGCGREYEESENTETSCHYHNGGPIFHEGLKSWSCCSDVNKPVLDFESFLAIPGCTVGAHSQDIPRAQPPQSSGVVDVAGLSSSTKTSPTAPEVSSSHDATTTVASETFSKPMAPAPPVIEVEEEDDTAVPVSVGAACRRRGCDAKFISEEESRGDTQNSVCNYHPAPPIFHEGSKGYLCCKRRVLEFDEFLKIQGCKTGRHVFVPKNRENGVEELVACRVDHYQTPTQVHVTVFAKQTDETASTIQIEESKVHLDLRMPSKRFKRTLDLYGPIDATASTYRYFGTKVELVLAKADMRSWSFLEKSNVPTNSFNLTFGVGGRTGTVGAKELHLDEDNKLRST